MPHEEVMPSGYDEEERYFHEKDVELLKKTRAKLDAVREERRSRQFEEQHWMKCPKCGAEMQEIDLDQIKVDKCSRCEGVFFDKGEVELLIESHSVLHPLRKIFNLKPPKAFS